MKTLENIVIEYQGAQYLPIDPTAPVPDFTRMMLCEVAMWLVLNTTEVISPSA